MLASLLKQQKQLVLAVAEAKAKVEQHTPSATVDIKTENDDAIASLASHIKDFESISDVELDFGESIIAFS